MGLSKSEVDELQGSDDDEEMTQLCVRTTRSSLRTFKRLADRKGQTLTQWVLDLCWEGVTRDLDELRKSIDESETEAQRERQQLAALERENELRMKPQASDSQKSKVRQNMPT